MGCDIAQGYLIGKPVALLDLIEKLDGPVDTAEVAAA
jgi:EAL domain-containing protein (putative c-di-GMP-specific phosphodiesterase class I)